MAIPVFDSRVVVEPSLQSISLGCLPGTDGVDRFYYALRADGGGRHGFIDIDAYVIFIQRKTLGEDRFGKPEIVRYNFSVNPPRELPGSSPILTDLAWNGSTMWPQIHVFKPESTESKVKIGVSIDVGDFDPAMAMWHRTEKVDPDPILVENQPDRCWVGRAIADCGTLEQIRSVFTDLLARHDQSIAAKKMDPAKHQVRGPETFVEGRILGFYSPGQLDTAPDIRPGL